MLYLINYRLHTPGKDYTGLYTAIEKLWGTHWRNTTSSWLIETSLSSKDVYEKIKQYVDSNDELIVFKISDFHGQLKPDDVAWLDRRRKAM